MNDWSGASVPHVDRRDTDRIDVTNIQSLIITDRLQTGHQYMATEQHLCSQQQQQQLSLAT